MVGTMQGEIKPMEYDSESDEEEEEVSKPAEERCANIFLCGNILSPSIKVRMKNSNDDFLV